MFQWKKIVVSYNNLLSGIAVSVFLIGSAGYVNYNEPFCIVKRFMGIPHSI
jgi:hypothetical protein